MDFRIYYEDTDCSGIVYHGSYFKFCERARSELFFQKMLSPQNQDGFFVVTDIEAKFLNSAKLGDLIQVKSKILAIKKVSLLLEQKVFLIRDSSGFDDIKELFKMNVQLAFLDSITKKPKKMPQYFLEVVNGG
ncbi:MULTISPECIES: YbgC/FadM family acyl-CoA thioesterase [unclassified Helicobacter]|uniref:YbgC/FadM family acyl-CoA thioesterase n=1 Tax=unclassified Helicobacter TaxID=2593540 RepID=UPI000CF0A316|nr:MULTISPECIES: YbgC/FadM family acyl-CoA thioesterase [unclassified Helicobacter]